MAPAKRVAVIGAGPAGAITIDALTQEKAFDIVRVFERREAPGGCWLGEANPPPILKPTELSLLASRTADPPFSIPPVLPAQTPKSQVPRYTESTVYPYLETNVDSVPMEFTQEPFPSQLSGWAKSVYGEDAPFRHWTLVLEYVRSLVERKGYQDFVSYNTTVERAEKVARADGADGEEWKLILRKEGERTYYFWEERFDAVVVASGHYSVPYIPHVDGLSDFAKMWPGSVIHSKHFRGRDAYRGKRVVVVGASVSAADIAYDLTTTAQTPIRAVVVGHAFNGYFGDEAFKHPLIKQVPSIARVEPRTRTVLFQDGTSVSGVDFIIFGTGYTWTLPFFQQPSTSSSLGNVPRRPVPTPRNNRIPNLYLHTIYTPDPSILFVGAVNAGLTFKLFEYQAVLAARLLAGRVKALPSIQEQERWEKDRIAKRGDGPKFALVFPDFKEYVEAVRALAGPPTKDGKGRALPPFDQVWFERFMAGHERRKDMWRRFNAKAREALRTRAMEEGVVRPRL
ncbi:dimethylaniline monooxygenase [Phyllosticta capitalensis]